MLRRPTVPEGCHHNAHMFYLVLQQSVNRDNVLDKLRNNGIHAVFHYVPLHSSPGGLKYGRTHGDMSNTNSQSAQLIRLPLWCGISEQEQDRVVDTLSETLKQ